MLRRATTTGRVERRRDRINKRLQRSAVNENGTNNNPIDNLDGSFKCALNSIPRNFNSYSCGSMSLRCAFCSAKHFQAEVTLRNTQSFPLCCHKGKIDLSTLGQNTLFKNLCDGLFSNDNSIKRRSKNYFENIRSYNSAFAMVSSEAKLSNTLLNGVYHFKIHNIFYHRAGALTSEYGRQPCYAQLYFYDVDTANQYRMRERANVDCNVDLMRALAVELDRVNDFVRSFRSMAE